jgi:hypothetical protein
MTCGERAPTTVERRPYRLPSRASHEGLLPHTRTSKPGSGIRAGRPAERNPARRPIIRSAACTVPRMYAGEDGSAKSPHVDRDQDRAVRSWMSDVEVMMTLLVLAAAATSSGSDAARRGVIVEPSGRAGDHGTGMFGSSPIPHDRGFRPATFALSTSGSW